MEIAQEAAKLAAQTFLEIRKQRRKYADADGKLRGNRKDEFKKIEKCLEDKWFADFKQLLKSEKS